MNPYDYEYYGADESPSIAVVYTCRACGADRFCTCTVLDGISTPMCCPCGNCPEWRVRR